MNELTILKMRHSAWRVGGIDAIEEKRRSLPRPYWLTRNLFGGTFAMDASASLTQTLLYLWGERLVVEHQLIRGLLSPGMHAVDVGANVGYYLMLLQQGVGPSGKVTLIEPSMENIPALQRNIELNGFGNVTLHPVAVGEEDGRMGFRAGINGGVTGLETGAYQVAIRPLDSLVERAVDFLKIDVEGFEGQVLRGAKRVLERDSPVLFLELHPHILPRYGHSMSGLLDDLRSIYGGSLEFYRDMSSELSAPARVAARYHLLNPVQRVVDPEACAEQLARDESGTLWCVAGRRAQA